MLIKYIKSVLWRVAKCLSYIEEARCLKVKVGNGPVSKSEVTNRNLKLFIRYINKMELENINHSNEQMKMNTNNRNVRLK